ncbi:MAG: coniferyl aldehyde dehydrogenase [Casimicrobiaceae bacterium]
MATPVDELEKTRATAPSALGGAFAAQRAAFDSERDPSLAARRDRLRRLALLTGEHEGEIVAAIAADFGTRPAQETRLAELFMVSVGIQHARRHLARWMAPRRVSTPLYLQPGTSRVVRQPLGVVGIISPWNYPFQLAILPAVAALAAGNRVMLKPSELTPRTSALLERLVAQHFKADEFTVVNGGADIGQAFSALPFDHLFFTGSTAVGRRIALAAAANLTPVTLELGGKSPALVHAGADLEMIAPRLAAGKLLNAGQTCIAPDYVLAPSASVDALARQIAASVRAMYPTLGDNPDYTSIVNDGHHVRLTALIEDAQRKGARVIAINPTRETLNVRQRKLAPTILLGVTPDMAVMQEEIFGPILPIEAYATLDEALATINGRPRPLALYMFGGDSVARQRVLTQTIAGGVTIDDTLWHFCNEELPFGGVGASGIGAYHGERGFLTFTHEKPVFTQPRIALTWTLQPPYGKRFEAMLKLIKKIA